MQPFLCNMTIVFPQKSVDICRFSSASTSAPVPSSLAHTLSVCVARPGFAVKSLQLSWNINENRHRSPHKNRRVRVEVGGELIAGVALCCGPLCSLKKYKYW